MRNSTPPVNERSSKVHLKGLNGLRAIAAIAVVVSHTGLALKDFGFSTTWRLSLAGFGVSIFFSLSGFLITYLLLQEKNQFGRINIKTFYIRRILRIWPLYYFYLLLALATLYYFKPEEISTAVFFYVFLLANIPFALDFKIYLLAHYWSLGVEEQFYAFWPWVVKTSKRLMRFLIVFTFCFIGFKFFTRYLDATTGYHWPYMLMNVTRFDCMTIGAIGAVLYYKRNKYFLQLCFSWVAQVVGWGSIVLMAFNRFHIASITDSELAALITVVLIVNVAANPKTIINLEKPIFDFIGRISYGVYVYHPLLIFLITKWTAQLMLPLQPGLKLIFLFTLVPVCTVFFSYVSYELLEKRFLLMKSKYSAIPSSDTKF